MLSAGYPHCVRPFTWCWHELFGPPGKMMLWLRKAMTAASSEPFVLRSLDLNLKLVVNVPIFILTQGVDSRIVILYGALEMILR